MPQSELSPEQFIQKIRNITKEVKRLEGSKSGLEGRLETLFERLKKETGFDSVEEARKEIKKAENNIESNNQAVSKMLGELEERDEWRLLIAKS